MLRRVFLALLSALCVIPLSAQVKTGLYRYGSFEDNGFDQIDRGSLNVHFSIPIFSKQGRGLPFQYSLVYDGLVWSTAIVNNMTVWTPDPAFGLRGDLLNDGYRGYLSYNVRYTKCYNGGTLLGNYPIYSSYVYHDQVGANHAFSQYTDTCNDANSKGDGSSNDGSGFSITGTAVKTLRGESLVLPTYVNGAPGPLNGSVTDLSGNQITISQSGVFTDTTGSNVLTVTGAGTASSPKVLTYLTPNGSAAATIAYKTYTVATNFATDPKGSCTTIGSYNKAADLPDTVTLADGSVYRFAYEPTSGTSSSVTGRLQSVTLPTGGTFSYSYSGNTNCDGTPTSLTRQTSDGSRTYSRSALTASSSHTNIIDAAGNASAYDFVIVGSPTAFFETKAALFTGAATGAPLSQTQTCYNAATGDCTATPITVPISQIDTYKTLDGKQQSGSTSKFNSFGLQTENDIYDFGGTSRGPLLSKEVWAYPTSGLADLVQSDTVYDAASNWVSQRLYNYDEAPPATTSGFPQHAGAIGNQRGNLTTVQDWLGTVGSPYVTSLINTYDDTGQLRSSVGPDSGKTQYGYDATNTFLTSVTLPTPSSGATLTSTASYDVNSGVLLNTTDPNGQVTTYSNYDSMNRAQIITAPDKGRTVLSFSPTQIVGYRDIDAATLAQTDYVLQFDGYGRKDRFAKANGQSPNGWYQEDYCYDANGRLAFQPVPYQNTGFSYPKQCSGSGDSTAYDGVGRPLKVIHVNTATTYSYSGRNTTVVDEYGVSKIQQQDGLGRIAAVCEVSSTGYRGMGGTPAACGSDIGATGFLTTYTYSLVNHTTVVNDGGQARLFGTDSLGRMTTLQEPEIFTGNSSTLTTFGYRYTATGLEVKRMKPQANQTNQAVKTTTTTQYDLLGRVVSVTYDDGWTPNKTYSYDTPATWAESGSQSNLKGRLSLAARQNGSAGTLFNYDPTGRVKTMWECQPSGCGNAARDRELDFAYDLAGRLISQGDATAGLIHYAYTPADEISGITNSTYNDATNPGTYVSAATNGPAGPTSYHLGNGLTVVGTYDSANRIQYRWLCAGGVTTSYCSGGTQIYGLNTGWQGSYLVSSIDTIMNTGGNYTYDDLGRLKSFVSTAGVSSTFNWSYDRWGNRWQQAPGASPNFDTSNHKLDSSTAYDSAGNMMKDVNHQYIYDAEGNLLEVDGGNTASYVYDALNQRVAVSVPSSATPKLEFTYDFAGRRITTWDANANFGIQGQVWWGSTPIAYRGAQGRTYFQQSDWEGTQRVLTDYAGNVLSRYTSNPFGDNFSANRGQDDNSLHYGQLERDAASGTEHAQFRQYDSDVAIWMSPDPYLGSYNFANPQSLNRYAYALNRPTSLTDPSGLLCQLVFLPAYSIDFDGGTVEGAADYIAFCDNNGGYTPGQLTRSGQIAASANLVPNYGALHLGPNSAAATARCAAANASSFANLVGVSKDNLIGQTLLGNDISTLSNLLTGPDRTGAALQGVVSNPTPANLLYQAGKAAGAGQTSQLALVQTASQDAFGNPQFYARTLALGETAGAKVLSKAFAAFSAAKLAYDVGAYALAYAQCSSGAIH